MQRTIRSNLCNALVLSMTVTLVAPTAAQQVTKLLASDGARNDLLGAAVAAQAGTLVAGAPADDAGRGAVYVFESVDGTWVQTARVTSILRNPSDDFGTSVAIDGDFLVVGAPGVADQGQDSGAAFVFERTPAGWIQRARILAPNGSNHDRFGIDVAISGDRIVIGADGDDEVDFEAGAAYVYRNTASGWILEQKLLPGTADFGDHFGTSVAIAGDLIVSGSPGATAAQTDAGAVFVFRRNGNLWQQEQRLTAPDASAFDAFGTSVTTDGIRIAVGATGDDDAGSNAGAVYVFGFDTGSWMLEDKVIPLGSSSGDMFGKSVDIKADLLVVGSPSDDSFQAGSNAGSVYLFRYDQAWSVFAKLLADDADSGDEFGQSVAIAGDLIAIGAPRDDALQSNAGAVYLFRPCTRDLDGDLDVDLGDLARMLGEFGCFNNCSADLDDDGDVDISDLSLLLANFGTTCPQ